MVYTRSIRGPQWRAAILELPIPRDTTRAPRDPIGKRSVNFVSGLSTMTTPAPLPPPRRAGHARNRSRAGRPLAGVIAAEGRPAATHTFGRVAGLADWNVERHCRPPLQRVRRQDDALLPRVLYTRRCSAARPPGHLPIRADARVLSRAGRVFAVCHSTKRDCMEQHRDNPKNKAHTPRFAHGLTGPRKKKAKAGPRTPSVPLRHPPLQQVLLLLSPARGRRQVPRHLGIRRVPACAMGKMERSGAPPRRTPTSLSSFRSI